MPVLVVVCAYCDADGMDGWMDRTTGDVNYVPITSTSPARNYWGIDQSIAYNEATILESTAGIVDTGAFCSYLAIFIAFSLHALYPNVVCMHHI